MKSRYLIPLDWLGECTDGHCNGLKQQWEETDYRGSLRLRLTLHAKNLTSWKASQRLDRLYKCELDSGAGSNRAPHSEGRAD
jgi:hypothetical protein